MKLLFLGGTGFVGRQMVSDALSRGHEVTLFTRNKTNKDIFPEAERLEGDRDGNLEALKGRTWDIVLDVNGYVPRLVSDSAKLLQGSVGHYLFVSAGNACDWDEGAKKGQFDEDAPRKVIGNTGGEEYWGADYGALKALCETRVEGFFPDCSSILRLGVVAGAHDPTDRVTYWVDRIARGGEVLVPAHTDDSFRFIDVNDLAAFTIKVAENKLNGIFHAFGKSLSWKNWLDACQSVSCSDVMYQWVNDVSFLNKHIDLQSRPFGALPMMSYGAAKVSLSCDKAIAAGLKYSAPSVTARNILSWQNTRNLRNEESKDTLEARGKMALDWGNEKNKHYWMAGLTSEQESGLLKLWREKENTSS